MANALSLYKMQRALLLEPGQGKLRAPLATRRRNRKPGMLHFARNVDSKENGAESADTPAVMTGEKKNSLVERDETLSRLLSFGCGGCANEKRQRPMIDKRYFYDTLLEDRGNQNDDSSKPRSIPNVSMPAATTTALEPSNESGVYSESSDLANVTEETMFEADDSLSVQQVDSTSNKSGHAKITNVSKAESDGSGNDSSRPLGPRLP